MNKKPTGLLPAVHTPFDATGDINLSVVSQQVDRLIEMQCGGVYVGGTKILKTVKVSNGWIHVIDNVLVPVE